MTAPIELLDPVELTDFARLGAEDFDAQVQSLSRYLPNRETGDIKYSYSKGVDALVDETVYRAFGAESPIGRRPGTGRVTGELLPLSRKVPLGEYENLRRRNAPQNEVVDEIFRDADRLARGIAARVERARGQLLQTGKVTIDENRVDQEYNAGRDAGHTIASVSPLWSSHSTATPLSNIIAWNELIRQKTGVTANRLLVSPVVMGHLQQCDEVRGALMALTLAPARVRREAVNEAFQGEGVTVELYEPPAGMLTSPIDPNWVVLLRDNIPLGGTFWGLTLEATESSDFYPQGPGPGIVAGAWKEGLDPITIWTKAVGIALPVMGAPDLTLSAKVI